MAGGRGRERKMMMIFQSCLLPAEKLCAKTASYPEVGVSQANLGTRSIPNHGSPWRRRKR
jgi:hypothetical protein